ncbi:DNA-directed RNA polymerase II subunit RPB1-like [Euwallacea similis]|uniref:DNA-directed RNA polymerase II subunit RPB1-like n=1 Tax=Euwallacea similis TaxID=1736056 RepID=UPI00344DDE3B
MQSVSVLIFLGILAPWPCRAVFLNHRPFPTYSLEDMPNTQFSCREKILGGYYADPDTQCQMFHICVKVSGIGIQDFRFLCPNGTAFDQDHQICAEWEDVDCDASTLYYSSDNFDLYRVGSGFESKAHKYGEDEETFALQRAETGDARINRDPQTQVVNQQKEYQRPQGRRPLHNTQEKDIFKTSSSSNFFNNRNNGKENDEDYDDNANVNQNRDYEQKRKLVRKPVQRRPVQQTTEVADTYKPTEQQVNTRRPQRPTGFVNNFAGSYNPTTGKPTTSTIAPTVNNNFRTRAQRPLVSQQSNPPTPSYTISTPAPFKRNKPTENYPQSRPASSVSYNTNYDVPKVTNKQQTENYPSNNPQYSKSTTPFVNSQYNTAAFDKKPTSPKKVDNYKPTTFSPNAKPFSIPKSPNAQQSTLNSFPTTFAPRTQQAFTQIAQQTNTYNTQNPTTFNQNPSTFNTFGQQNFNSPSTTQRSTTFTHYTPTVPKITPTTPVSRSNRFDETQYDDGSYDPKYDYNGEEEFLKASHSQNIASSRNELLRSQKKQQQQPQTTTTTTQRPFESSRNNYNTPTREPENYPKSFPSTNAQATPKPAPKTTPVQQKPQSPKKIKDVSYDYAYYDNLGPEPDYQIDTEIKKEKARN